MKEIKLLTDPQLEALHLIKIWQEQNDNPNWPGPRSIDLAKLARPDANWEVWDRLARSFAARLGKLYNLRLVDTTTWVAPGIRYYRWELNDRSRELLDVSPEAGS